MIENINKLLELAEKLATMKGVEGRQGDIEKMKEALSNGEKPVISSGIRGQIFGKEFGGGPLHGGGRGQTEPEFKPNVFKKPDVSKKKTVAPKVGEVQELELEVFEEKDCVKIIGEMPGVEKKEIEYQVDGKTLKVHTTGKRKYENEIELPVEVSKDVDLGYRNGILEIILKKTS